MEGILLYWEFQEKGDILFYQKTLFTGESERYVKEAPGNRQISP
jgi:hypothetical protein